jgi:hypothetical protein
MRATGGHTVLKALLAMRLQLEKLCYVNDTSDRRICTLRGYKLLLL